MLTDASPAPPHQSFAQRLRDWITSTKNADPSGRALLADLERLADTSPHLLADLGFHESRTDPSGITTWRRGPLRVIRHPGAAETHHAFRMPRG